MTKRTRAEDEEHAREAHEAARLKQRRREAYRWDLMMERINRRKQNT